MVVQHNLTAMNANRMFNLTQSSLSSSTEKLSSGYKINRAADDAAGLSISEKMRKQIRGLTQASTNAEDGISAVQTAEGALSEVTDMLQRMNELAVKAANGTNSESDRQTIQDEISQLTTEIDRVSETTKFNEIYLLKGNADGTKSSQLVNAHDAGLAGTLVDNGKTATFSLDEALKDGDTVTIAGKEYTIGAASSEKAATTGSVLSPDDLNTSSAGFAATTDAPFDGSVTMSAGDSVTYDGNTYTLVNKIASDKVSWADQDTFTVGSVSYSVTDTAANAKAGNAAAATGTAYVAAADAQKLIDQALADDKQVYATKASVETVYTAGASAGTGTGAIATATQIVSELGEGEVSTASTTDGLATSVVAAGKQLTQSTISALNVGDSVTISGTTTTATAYTPWAAVDVYNDVSALTAGNYVTIYDGEEAHKYTVVDSADEEDPDSYKLTTDSILAKIQDGNTVDINGTVYTVIGDVAETAAEEDSNSASDTISVDEAYKLMADELQKASSIGTDEGSEASVVNNGDGTFEITKGSAVIKDSLSFNLHVGADADMTNKITVNIQSMSAAGLGVQGLNVVDKTGAAATYAIDSIEDAINTVSAQRSLLGAVQNRLDHTINDLDNVVENTTSAESEIRDTDMATEMVKYSNANILSQAGQSMLAQANQSNQGVLSLLG
jgi:flagellin-like hook-associated protein FlgL